MFQTTDSAPGSSGFVYITDLKGGKVGFSPEDNNNEINTINPTMERGMEKEEDKEAWRERERGKQWRGTTHERKRERKIIIIIINSSILLQWSVKDDTPL